MCLGKQIGLREFPKLHQGSLASAKRQAADFMFDIEYVLPEPFAIDAARRDLREDLIDDVRKGTHEGAAGMAVG